MDKKEKIINQIEKEIKTAQSYIKTWENNLERYKTYLQELTNQLIVLKLEIKRNITKK